jgi:hypothetical protein
VPIFEPGTLNTKQDYYSIDRDARCNSLNEISVVFIKLRILTTRFISLRSKCSCIKKSGIENLNKPRSIQYTQPI